MLSILSGFAGEELCIHFTKLNMVHSKSISKLAVMLVSPPYGYTKVDGEMVIVPEEAETSHQNHILSECLSGKVEGTIDRGLNKDKIPVSRRR